MDKKLSIRFFFTSYPYVYIVPIDINISIATYSCLKFDHLMDKFFMNDCNIFKNNFKNNFQLELMTNFFLYIFNLHIFHKFK